MDERVKFIARMLDGEAMSRLCEEFSISCQNPEALSRLRVEGLTDRSRRPYRHARRHRAAPGGSNWASPASHRGRSGDQIVQKLRHDVRISRSKASDASARIGQLYFVPKSRGSTLLDPMLRSGLNQP